MRIGWAVLLLAVLASATDLAAETEEERKAKQAELDAACEAARQKKLVEARAEYVEECVRKAQRPTREACERFYADYGEGSANQAPLFYDLPECVAAHEYRRSYRRSDR